MQIPADMPIATLAVPGMLFAVRERATDKTLLSGVDLDTALAEIERLDTEAGARNHYAQEIFS